MVQPESTGPSTAKATDHERRYVLTTPCELGYLLKLAGFQLNHLYGDSHKNAFETSSTGD